MDVKDQPAELIEILKRNGQQALWVVGVFSFFINLLMLTLPLYMLQVFDRVLASFSGETLLYLTLIAAFMLFIFGALTAIRSHLLIHLGDWLDKKMSAKTLMRSMDDILAQNPYGTQALQDVFTVRNFLSSPAITALFDAPWVPFFILIIFFLNPWLGVLSLIGAIALFLCGYFNEKLTIKYTLASKQHATIANAQYEIMKNNPDTIQGMGMLNATTAKWAVSYKKALDEQNAASKRSGEILALSKLLRILLQIFMLGGGAYLVILNQFTPGMMIAGTILLGRALAPVEQSIGAWRQVILAREAFMRLKQYMLTPLVS